MLKHIARRSLISLPLGNIANPRGIYIAACSPLRITRQYHLHILIIKAKYRRKKFNNKSAKKYKKHIDKSEPSVLYSNQIGDTAHSPSPSQSKAQATSADTARGISRFCGILRHNAPKCPFITCGSRERFWRITRENMQIKTYSI